MNPSSLKNLKRGGQPGRRRGIPNKVTLEIRDAARAIVEDDAYVESLKRRVIAGRAPHMETLLFHYAYGKPKDQVEVSGAAGAVTVVRFVDVSSARAQR
jgi:hypothetical protein